MPIPSPAPISAPISRLPNSIPVPAPSNVPHNSPAGIAIDPQNGKADLGCGPLVVSFTAHSCADPLRASTLLDDQLALWRLAQVFVLVHGAIGGGHHGLQVVAAVGERRGTDIDLDAHHLHVDLECRRKHDVADALRDLVGDLFVGPAE